MKHLFLALLLASVAFGLWSDATEAQTVYVKIDKSSSTEKLAFDWDGKDIGGDPISLARAEFVFYVDPPPSPPPPPTVLPTAQPPVLGVNEYPVKAVTSTIPVGTYKLIVRGVSAGGVASDDSAPLFVEVVQSKKPGALKNLRLVTP